MKNISFPIAHIEEYFDIEIIPRDKREEYLHNKLKLICSNDQFEGKIYALAEMMSSNFTLNKIWDVIAIKDSISNTDIGFFMALPDDLGLYHVTATNGNKHYLNGMQFGIVVSAITFNNLSYEIHDPEIIRIIRNYFVQLRGYLLSLDFETSIKIIELLD